LLDRGEAKRGKRGATMTLDKADATTEPYASGKKKYTGSLKKVGRRKKKGWILPKPISGGKNNNGGKKEIGL